MFKRILVVFILVLISACGASNDEEADAENFKQKGDWGRAFLLYDDIGKARCIKEILSITEANWKVYQFIYNDAECDYFLFQVEFDGDLVTVANSVVDGLPVNKLRIVNIDWTWMDSFEPFFSSRDLEFNEQSFAIMKVMFWGKFKVDTFDLFVFEDSDTLFSNIFTPFISYIFPSLSVDSSSINLDSNYLKIDSITKEEVDRIELR